MSDLNKATLTIIGLGPGSIDDLTLEAHKLLVDAANHNQCVYFRTLIHPVVEPLKQNIPTLRIESFDRLYDESNEWNALYSQIADEVCNLAAQQPLIYAVPGHPLIGETSVQLILERARERNLSTRIVDGISAIDWVCKQLQLDPWSSAMQMVDATNLASWDTEEVAGKIVPTQPVLIVQVYNRRVASAVKLALSECYPDDWPVKMVRSGVGDTEETILEMPLYEIDRSDFARHRHLASLYIAPVDELTALRIPETLRYITMRLRRDPDGCPWDRKQTHASLKRYVIEEAYEVIEALDEQDMDKLAEELGDLLLQVYLHAEVARQSDEFTPGDVYEHINEKLIRRHPHVFGDVNVENADQVKQNREDIKRQERADAGMDTESEGLLDRVPLASPALMVAQEYQKRAVKAGFEYDSIEGVYDKLAEELQELKEAKTPEEHLEEMGDILFIAAKLARFLHIDAEEALRLANRKFRQRFQAMERFVREEGCPYDTYTTSEWEALWQRAKASLRDNS